jgi:hypothetical protein
MFKLKAALFSAQSERDRLNILVDAADPRTVKAVVLVQRTFRARKLGVSNRVGRMMLNLESRVTGRGGPISVSVAETTINSSQVLPGSPPSDFRILKQGDNEYGKPRLIKELQNILFKESDALVSIAKGMEEIARYRSIAQKLKPELGSGVRHEHGKHPVKGNTVVNSRLRKLQKLLECLRLEEMEKDMETLRRDATEEALAKDEPKKQGQSVAAGNSLALWFTPLSSKKTTFARDLAVSSDGSSSSSSESSEGDNHSDSYEGNEHLPAQKRKKYIKSSSGVDGKPVNKKKKVKRGRVGSVLERLAQPNFRWKLDKSKSPSASKSPPAKAKHLTHSKTIKSSTGAKALTQSSGSRKHRSANEDQNSSPHAHHTHGKSAGPAAPNPTVSSWNSSGGTVEGAAAILSSPASDGGATEAANVVVNEIQLAADSPAAGPSHQDDVAVVVSYCMVANRFFGVGTFLRSYFYGFLWKKLSMSSECICLYDVSSAAIFVFKLRNSAL